DDAGGVLREAVAGIHRPAVSRRADLYLGNRKTMRACARDVIVACTLLWASSVVAGQSGDARSAAPDEDRFINTALPNIAVTTAAGRRTTLMEAAGGRPMLLALVFTRCTGVCSPFVASWRSADAWVRESGRVHRVVLSFDPRDTVTDMAEFARHFG